MADATAKRPGTETAAGVPLGMGRRARVAAWAAGGVALAVIGVLVIAAVREGEQDDRWDALWKVSRDREEEPATSIAAVDPLDVPARDEHIEKLEELLKTAEGPVAAHAHARIANLQVEQIHALADGPFDVRRPRYDSAIHHLRTLVEKHPNAPMVRADLRPEGYTSEAHRLLATLEKNRAWDEAHSPKDLAPDDDPVLLLRTTAGDVRLRFYGKDAPERTKRFLDRACAGALDGTHLMGRRDQARESYAWGLGSRTKTDATAAARKDWDEPTQAPVLAPEAARHRALHLKGVVSTWHPLGQHEGDPEHVLFVLEDSPGLDHTHTPFARATDAASLETIDRIASRRTFRQEKPDSATDPAVSEISDQLMDPVRVVKALVYRQGALDACHAAATVRDTEKRLDTVVPDEEVPAPPPAPPASTDGAAPPPVPSDGAGSGATPPSDSAPR